MSNDSKAWREWGGDGPWLHFAHANGFPPESYRTLLELLTARFRVVTFAARPLHEGSNPSVLSGWHELADDLAATLREHGLRDAVGVGHSLGGVLTAWAAAADRDLFSRLVLLDPVLFAGRRTVVWGWMKRLGLAGRLPLVRAARRRRDRFGSIDEARGRWQKKRVFRRFDPRCFEDYLAAAFRPDDGEGVVLRYPKAWEARIFERTPHDPWPRLRELDVPVTVLTGERTDTFRPEAARRLRREHPGARITPVPGTSHFLPFERPDAIAERIG